MLKDILIRDWMSPEVICVSKDTTITHAHEIMKQNRIRRLPVLEDGKLIGIVTVGDVREARPSGATTLSIWELNYLWSQLQIKDVMSRRVITVHVDEPVIAAAQRMLEHKVSGLPVLDAAGKVVGIITESDIFRMVVELQTIEV